MKVTKTVYWIRVNGKRYCCFDNVQDAKYMAEYIRSTRKEEIQELAIEADAKMEDEQ